jgi:hypothetical protein
VGGAKKYTAETQAGSIQMANATHAKGQQDAASSLAKDKLEVAGIRFCLRSYQIGLHKRDCNTIWLSPQELKEQQVESKQVLRPASGFTDEPFDVAV